MRFGDGQRGNAASSNARLRSAWFGGCIAPFHSQIAANESDHHHHPPRLDRESCSHVTRHLRQDDSHPEVGARHQPAPDGSSGSPMSVGRHTTHHSGTNPKSHRGDEQVATEAATIELSARAPNEAPEKECQRKRHNPTNHADHQCLPEQGRDCLPVIIDIWPDQISIVLVGAVEVSIIGPLAPARAMDGCPLSLIVGLRVIGLVLIRFVAVIFFHCPGVWSGVPRRRLWCPRRRCCRHLWGRAAGLREGPTAGVCARPTPGRICRGEEPRSTDDGQQNPGGSTTAGAKSEQSHRSSRRWERQPGRPSIVRGLRFPTMLTSHSAPTAAEVRCEATTAANRAHSVAPASCGIATRLGGR